MGSEAFWKVLSVSRLFLYEKKPWTLIIKQTKSTFVAYIPRHAKHWWMEIWVHLQLLGHVVDRLVNFERWFKTSEMMGSFSAEKTGGFLSLQLVVSDYREVENKHSKKNPTVVRIVYILYHFVI